MADSSPVLVNGTAVVNWDNDPHMMWLNSAVVIALNVSVALVSVVLVAKRGHLQPLKARLPAAMVVQTSTCLSLAVGTSLLLL